MISIPRLDTYPPDHFPDPAHALGEPNGLLAFGGDLSPKRLLAAYRRGIFPWYADGDPLLWWSPDPRCVFPTDGVHVSHSLARMLHKSSWQWSMDRAFEPVMRACGEPRRGQDDTWITEDMVAAYTRLHRLGHAHSLEIWDGEALIGGVYGVTVGLAFSAESMFSRRTNASKVALVALATVLRTRNCPIIDAQISNPHLLRMGACTLPRCEYLDLLRRLVATPDPGDWPQARSPVATLEHLPA